MSAVKYYKMSSPNRNSDCFRILVKRRHEATHYDRGEVNLVSLAWQKKYDNHKLSTEECKHPAAYWNIAEAHCDLCAEDPEALCDYAAYVSNIYELRHDDHTIVGLSKLIVQEETEGAKDKWTTKLVLADHLDELGDKQGELIRIRWSLDTLIRESEKLKEADRKIRGEYDPWVVAEAYGYENFGWRHSWGSEYAERPHRASGWLQFGDGPKIPVEGGEIAISRPETLDVSSAYDALMHAQPITLEVKDAVFTESILEAYKKLGLDDV